MPCERSEIDAEVVQRSSHRSRRNSFSRSTRVVTARTLAVLPEHGLAQAEESRHRIAALVDVTALHVRVERKPQADARARIEAAALSGRRAIRDAGERLLLIHRAVRALQGARIGAALGDVLVAIHAPDEGVEALVELRQRHVDAKTQLRLEAAELVPQQRGSEAALCSLIILGRMIGTEPAIHVHGGFPHRVVDALLHVIEPLIVGWRPLRLALRLRGRRSRDGLRFAGRRRLRECTARRKRRRGTPAAGRPPPAFPNF